MKVQPSQPLVPIVVGLVAVAALIGLLTFPLGSGKRPAPPRDPAAGASQEADTPAPRSRFTPADADVPPGPPSVGLNDPQEQERAAIKQCFIDFREAVKTRKGQAAAEQVDQATFTYYAQLRDSALYDGPDQLQGVSIMDRTAVGMFRVLLTSADLGKLDGRGLFTYAVDRGCMNRRGLTTLNPGAVFLDSYDAARVLMNDQSGATGFHFRFRREGDAWKLDFPSTLALAEKIHADLIARKKAESDVYIRDTIRMTTGRQAKSDIWQPMLKERPVNPQDPAAIDLPPLE
jgi:hypothetical protein